MLIEHPGVTFQERVELYKLVVARSDISEALFACRLFMKTIHSMQDEGYLYFQNSIIVAYARPFKRSRPHGSLSQEWPGFTNESFQKAHELILENRDKLVAHSDGELRRVKIVPPGSTSVPDHPPSVGLGVQLNTSKIALDYLSVIENTCFDLGKRLNDKVDSELERMYGKMSLPKDPFDLLETKD